jgi:ribosomal protein S18 acetylase RimI-like enzyme
MTRVEIYVEPTELIADAGKFPRDVEAHRPESPVETIKHGLAVFNLRIHGELYHPLRVFLRTAKSLEVQGGLLGETGRGAFHITELWVVEPLRRHGYGTQLLEAAEAAALARGCRFAHVETFNFHAPDFYQRRGYEVFGTLEGFTGGHTCFYLRKPLRAA